MEKRDDFELENETIDDFPSGFYEKEREILLELEFEQELELEMNPVKNEAPERKERSPEIRWDRLHLNGVRLRI